MLRKAEAKASISAVKIDAWVRQTSRLMFLVCAAFHETK